jgi:HEAT repeat protein
MRSRKRARLDEIYLQKMDPILLEDLPAGSTDPDSLLFRQGVARICEPLQKELLKINWFSRRAHGRALKRVMLGMSRELVGETRARLTLAFQIFGFVKEELHDLASRRWWIKAKACRNLALMRAGDATSDLIMLLNDDEEDVRTEAAMALVNIAGVKALDPLFTNLHRVSVWMSIQLSKAILAMGSAAVPALVESLKSEDTTVKAFSTEMLGEIGDIRACAPLIELAESATVEVRCKALLSLGKLGDEAGKHILLENLSSEDERLRISAARGLGFLASPETAPALKQHLLNDTIRVRIEAGRSLERIDAAGHSFLKEAYQESDALGKRIVYQFLERLGVEVEHAGGPG